MPSVLLSMVSYPETIEQTKVTNGKGVRDTWNSHPQGKAKM